MVLPAAVLFATVFSIGAFTRHAEVTAAKASGISFYRMIMPILLGAVLACGLDLVLGEVVADHEPAAQRAAPAKTRRRSGTSRYNFAFAGEYGRVYKAYELRTDSGRIASCRSSERDPGRRIRRTCSPPTRRSYDVQPRRSVGAATGRRCTSSATGSPTSRSRSRRRATTDSPSDPVEMMTKSPDPHNMRYEEHHALHHGDRAIGRRRQPARASSGRSRSPSGHVHHHRAVRRAACDEHAARRSAYGIAVSLATR